MFYITDEDSNLFSLIQVSAPVSAKIIIMAKML